MEMGGADGRCAPELSDDDGVCCGRRGDAAIFFLAGRDEELARGVWTNVDAEPLFGCVWIAGGRETAARVGSTRAGTLGGGEDVKREEDAIRGGLSKKWVAGKELSMSMMSPSRGGRLLGQRDTVQRRRGLIDCGGAALLRRGVSRVD